MEPWPTDFFVGDPERGRHVVRHGELLLAFDEGTPGTTITQVLGDFGLSLHPAPEDRPIERNLNSFFMRWVHVSPKEDPQDVARRLQTAVPELWMASPVYDLAENPGGADASAPIPDVMMAFPAAPGDSFAAAFEPLNLLRDAYWSELTRSMERYTLVSGIPDDGFQRFLEAEAIAGTGRVEFDWVRLDCVESPLPAPTYGYKKHQWNLKASCFDEAAPIEPGDPEVVVAVIDTGFDVDHPAMVGAYSATRRTFGPKTAVATDVSVPAPDEVDWPDARWHGTCVAGIVAARDGVVGVAGQCRVMPARVVPPSGSNVAAALLWAAGQGARVASLSLSVTSQMTTLQIAIRDAAKAGLLLFAAAGNYGAGYHAVKFPARLNDVVAVGASVPGGGRKEYPTGLGEERWQSATGPTLDVLAPGLEIPTIDASGPAGYNKGGGTQTVNWYFKDYTPQQTGDDAGDFLFCFTGTSSAAPQAAAVAALLIARNEDLSSEALRNAIQDTCDSAYGRSDDEGWGLVNARAALQSVPLKPKP